ncbi:hypothetical protein GCM10027035_33910 [Emticicia sediminis]
MKSRFTISRILQLVCIAFALSFSTFAQQNKKISLQGFLKDANGKAVENSTNYQITFKLYTTLTGGTAAWTETQSLNISGGVYSTQLGQTTSLENLNWGTSTYYVGVNIQGVELSPRTELTFAPYSLGSPFAEQANTVVCSGAVGDVKYSILNPTQFAAVNGNCWIPMDGRTMAGSKLAGIIGGTNVPNAGGLFLRGQESADGSTNNDPDRTSSSTIAILQQDSFKGHNHGGSTTSNGLHSHGFLDTVPDIYQWNIANQYLGNSKDTFLNNVNPKNDSDVTNSDGIHSHTINSDGGSETRPKNLNLWTYIRIN